MTIKLNAAIAVVSWFGWVAGALGQLAVGPETLIPIGVSIACLLAAVAAAWGVRGWVARIENRLDRLENGKDE